MIAILPSWYLKVKRPNIWLVSERKDQAKDNGYIFFKYLCEKQKNVDAVYAIDNKSEDYNKVKEIGSSVTFGTLKHWIYYLAAEKTISSQKNGKPNSAICYFLEVYGVLPQKFYFLQHGVIINDCKWLYYEETKFKLFVCGAEPEAKFVANHFNYPDGKVKYLGLSRFDNLHHIKVKKNRILIMPTWREWIAENGSKLLEVEGNSNFNETEFFIEWKKLLTDNKFISYIKKNNLEVIFYPHHEMQKFLSYFEELSTPIKVASSEKYDIQELLKNSEMMITDYSSVFFDFVYMKKPIIFYQFDIDKFNKFQYQEGYFSYQKNKFGKSYSKSTEIVDKIIEMHMNNYRIDSDFDEEHKKYFPLFDVNNSKRIFNEIGGDSSD